MDKYMMQAEVVKALTHPFLAFTVLIGWMAMIFSGTEVPVTYEGIASTVAGSWAIKRTYKEYKEVQNKKNGMDKANTTP